MTDEQRPDTPETPENAEAAPAPARSKKKLLLTVAGLVGGVAVGTFVVGPGIGSHAGGAAQAHAAKSTTSKEGDSKDPTEIRQPHLIENLVLNPAGSRGTRFLLLSVGILMNDAVADDEVRRRDAEARDRVVQVLGAHTVEELVDITKRDQFRRELAASLDSLIGQGKVKTVLFPQFVIQ